MIKKPKPRQVRVAISVPKAVPTKSIPSGFFNTTFVLMSLSDVKDMMAFGLIRKKQLAPGWPRYVWDLTD